MSRKNEDKEFEELTDQEKEKLADELFSEVYEVQKENLDIAHRLIKQADEGYTISGKINEELHKQTEQLKGINEELDTLEGQIKIARRQLIGFLRSIQSDRALSIVITGIVILIIIVLIIVLLCNVGICFLICSIFTQKEKCSSIIGSDT